jgi:DNA-3-methyladenine glycosylase
MLLGARLIRDPDPGSVVADPDRRVGRIVEVEAYIGEQDLASHARFGRTARNAVMYGPPGIAYVYLVYGMYDCLNIVTETEGSAAAVLVRAVEPLAGLASMRAARQQLTAERRRARGPDGVTAGRGVADHRLASGPGLVAAAFGITRADTGRDLCDPMSTLRLEAAPPDEPAPAVAETRRIGIDYAGEPWTSRPWRFVVTGHRSVSGPARLR